MNSVHTNTSRIIAVALLVVVSAWPGFADERFKASSIKGDYGFTCTGTVYGNPFAGVGQVSCDGRSTCWGAGTLNPNGISLPWTFIGSYTLGADGRGQVTYDQTGAGSAAGQLHIDFVVMDGGRELRGMPTESGYIVTCELARQ
jgi:hypothetical protein